MRALRGAGALTRSHLLRSLRSRTALFWNFAFPLVWLFVFGAVFAGGTARGTGFLMPGLYAITVLAISFAGASYRMVNERERGTLRRYRVTPVRAPAVVSAAAASSAVLLAASLLLMGVTAWLAFGTAPGGALAGTVVVLAAGSVAFVPLGLTVGCAAPSTESAPAINNAIFFPLLFVTGAALPFSMLPAWVREAGRALPPTYLVEALQAVLVRGEGLGAVRAEIAVLLATGAVGAAAASLLFRWEAGEPVDRRRLAAALAALALLCAAVWWVGPELAMAEQAHPEGIRMLGG